jgi:hypothetical protein
MQSVRFGKKHQKTLSFRVSDQESASQAAREEASRFRSCGEAGVELLFQARIGSWTER